MGLLMVWLSRRFIDETIRTGTTRDVIVMVTWLVLTVVGGVLLRQVYFLLTTKASIRQTNAIRLRKQRENIDEEMRMLYVALTRAREKLIVVGTAEIYAVQALLCPYQYRGYTPCHFPQLRHKLLGFWQAS